MSAHSILPKKRKKMKGTESGVCRGDLRRIKEGLKGSEALAKADAGWKRRAVNVQHPTSNIQHPSSRHASDGRKTQCSQSPIPDVGSNPASGRGTPGEGL